MSHTLYDVFGNVSCEDVISFKQARSRWIDAVMNMCHVWNTSESALHQAKTQEDSLCLCILHMWELNLVVNV